MKIRLKLIPLILLILPFFAAVVGADSGSGTEPTGLPQQVDTPTSLQVAIIQRPPFVYKDANGSWAGYSIDLFEAVAESAAIEYQFEEVEVFTDMIDGVRAGQYDLAVANISITPERESFLDFSQPIYDSGFQIVASRQTAQPSIVSIIWNSGILWLIVVAFLILLIVAHLMWYFERGMPKEKHDYFRDDYVGGIFDAFWWAFIVVTIGGFENERPENTMGRILAIFWIVASLFFVSTLTAQITTSLTISQLSSTIETVDDLRGKRVGSVPGTAFGDYLESRGINYIPYTDFADVLTDLSNGELDAAIGDAPVVQFYAANDQYQTVVLVGELFEPDKFAFAVADNHESLEPINQALIELQKDGTVADIHSRYFGR